MKLDLELENSMFLLLFFSGLLIAATTTNYSMIIASFSWVAYLIWKRMDSTATMIEEAIRDIGDCNK